MNTSVDTLSDWGSIQRRLVEYGYSDQLTLQVHTGANTQIPLLKASSKHKDLLERQLEDDGWRTLDPWASTSFNDLNQQKSYRQNIILKDGDKTILQRMGIFSFNNFGHQRREEERGRELLFDVHQKAKCHQEKSTRTTHPVYHFGIWTDRVEKLYITKDTRQDKQVMRKGVKSWKANELAADSTMKFCLWTHDYVDKFVNPLVRSSRYGVDPEIKANFDEHREVYKWLLDEKFAAAAHHICHPIYSTFSPFIGFSENVHDDKEDSDFSFLINLGAKCLLSLDSYKLKIDLQPFDVVFFDTKIPHKTEAKPGDPAHMQRWAISGYVRQLFADIAVSEEPSAADHVVARAVALRQEMN